MVKCNICRVNNKIAAGSGVYKCRHCDNMVTAPKISKETKDLYREAEKFQHIFDTVDV